MTTKLRSPIQWFGGKGKMTAKIVPLLNQIEHKYYAEPFGGGASVLLAKPPASVETYNDLDSALYDFFMTLADDAAFERFYRKVAVLPYSRQLYNECRADWRAQTERHERVWRWYVVARMSFGGRFGHSLGTVVTASNRGMAATTSNWLSALDMLPRIHDRLQRVQLENAPALRIIERYDTPDTLFYCDPPYPPSTRKGGGYAHEMTHEDHAALVAALLKIKGKAALSCYDHPVYQPLAAAGWQRVDWQTACHVAGRTRNSGLQGAGAARAKQARTETLWVSPGALARQLELTAAAA